MKFAKSSLLLALVILVGSNAGAVLPGGCVDPGVPPTPFRPVNPPLAEEILVALPAAHEVHGVRTAGFQTVQTRVFEIRASGYLSNTGSKNPDTAPRYSRSRIAVSLSSGYADWGKEIVLQVDKLADFRIIVRSGNPSSFDAFAFVDVHPGTYVFTLDTTVRRNEPVDIDLEHRGRVVGTRTVYPEAMAHPARVPAQKKRAPRGDLQVTHSR